MIEDDADRRARLAARLWRAVEAGSISRRGMLRVLALAAGSALPAGRALASSLAEPPTVACGDTAGLPPSPDCPADRLIVKPIPAERFRILGAGSAEMRWDRLSGSDYRVPTKDFYVHNRSCPPRFDPATWRLTVEGDAPRRSRYGSAGGRHPAVRLRGMSRRRAHRRWPPSCHEPCGSAHAAVGLLDVGPPVRVRLVADQFFGGHP